MEVYNLDMTEHIQEELPFSLTPLEAVESAAEHAFEQVVEQPAPRDSPEGIATAVSDLKDAGLDEKQWMTAVERLKQRGIPLDVNNIRRGLLLRRIKKDRESKHVSARALLHLHGLALPRSLEYPAPEKPRHDD